MFAVDGANRISQGVKLEETKWAWCWWCWRWWWPWWRRSSWPCPPGAKKQRRRRTQQWECSRIKTGRGTSCSTVHCPQLIRIRWKDRIKASSSNDDMALPLRSWSCGSCPEARRRQHLCPPGLRQSLSQLFLNRFLWVIIISLLSILWSNLLSIQTALATDVFASGTWIQSQQRWTISRSDLTPGICDSDSSELVNPRSEQKSRMKGTEHEKTSTEKNRWSRISRFDQESQYQNFLQELWSQILERENLQSATKNRVQHVVSSTNLMFCVLQMLHHHHMSSLN